MSNFKIGEKVCIIGCNNIGMIVPIKNEIVTIKSMCTKHEDSYFIEEYQYAKNGNTQSFHSDHIRKLDHQFGEDVCAEILKKVKEESLISVN